MGKHIIKYKNESVSPVQVMQKMIEIIKAAKEGYYGDYYSEILEEWEIVNIENKGINSG